MTPYQHLTARMNEASLAGSAASVLSWDLETYQPKAGNSWRGEQMAWLSGQAHRLSTAPEVGDWLKACEDEGFAEESVEAVNLRGWRRDYRRAVCLSPEFVEEFSRTTTVAHEVWIEARKASDFTRFQPILEKLIELSQRKADAYGWTVSRYDALMDEYEPGMRSADIAALFSSLGPKLRELIGPAVEYSRRVPENLLQGHYPQAAQAAFNAEVARAIGFDFEAGRIDTSVHPFCTGLGPGDTRLTTRYDEGDFLSSLYGVLHEAGHGMYDQGLNAGEWGRPAGSAVSLGIHESQSRLWENHVGSSLAFWEHWLPKAADHFPNLKNLSPEQITAYASRVKPDFIRVEADEVTYDQHIILRFEIEKQLIEGTLPVADVPAFWNERFEQLLGLKVPEDRLGCLQDVHWSFGGFGYFSTYTLGNLNAAQLMVSARAALPDLDGQLAQGTYVGLLSWLREHIHTHGRRFDPAELMSRATGQSTGTEAHLAHLRRKYVA